MKKEEIQILLQRAEEAENEMFSSSSTTNWESLNFLAGKIVAYTNVLIILEKEEER